MDSVLQNNIGLAAPPCPQCNHQGIMVRNITVQNLILPELKEKIVDKDTYYLCSDLECNISYLIFLGKIALKLKMSKFQSGIRKMLLLFLLAIVIKSLKRK